VVALSVVYRNQVTHFWRCLHGACPTIDVVINNYTVADVTDARTWLEARWREKDQLIGRDGHRNGVGFADLD